MQQLTTQGIVLARTNFGEADRIITFLTPDRGKLSGMVKAARKTRSKLAGGIELFSLSDISFISGRGELVTITSTRLVRHYGNIVKDLERTNTGYHLIKTLNKATEDNPESEYFRLLDSAFAALDNQTINLELIKIWFTAQLLRLAGHRPNLETDPAGQKLLADQVYDFDFEAMTFKAGQTYRADQIKFLRLIFANNLPKTLQQVGNSAQYVREIQALLTTLAQA